MNPVAVAARTPTLGQTPGTTTPAVTPGRAPGSTLAASSPTTYKPTTT
jgi:hypothetical protein